MAEEKPAWQVVHERLKELAAERAAIDYEEATLLIAARRLAIWVHLGLGSLREYVERTLGHPSKSAAERLRVADVLDHCPRLGGALRDGSISWSAARELTRVADADTEQEWLAVASGRTVREVERLVSGHLPGDRPTDPVSDDARRHVIRLEVSGATLALFRDAQEKLVRETGGSVCDDDLVQLMARQVLGGPMDSGRSSYQVATFVCERCGRGWQNGRGELVAITPEEVATACCDAQHVGKVDGGAPAKASQEIPPAIRRQVVLRDHGKCVVPGCTNSVFVDVHHLDPRADGGGHDPDRLALLCSAHHRAVHAGRLVVEGSASKGLVFRHADGRPYGGRLAAALAAAAADAFLALKALGFKEKESRKAVDAVVPHVGEQATVQDIIKGGLAILCGHARAAAAQG